MKELELYNCDGLACVSLKNYNDALEEIERLNNKLEFKETNIKGLENNIEVLEEVIKKYENIIKEVREYINKNGILDLNGYDILEILEKVGSDKE